MSQPRVTTLDTNLAYPVAIQRLKEWVISMEATGVLITL